MILPRFIFRDLSVVIGIKVTDFVTQDKQLDIIQLISYFTLGVRVVSFAYTFKEGQIATHVEKYTVQLDIHFIVVYAHLYKLFEFHTCFNPLNTSKNYL